MPWMDEKKLWMEAAAWRRAPQRRFFLLLMLIRMRLLRAQGHSVTDAAFQIATTFCAWCAKYGATCTRTKQITDDSCQNWSCRKRNIGAVTANLASKNRQPELEYRAENIMMNELRYWYHVLLKNFNKFKSELLILNLSYIDAFQFY